MVSSHTQHGSLNLHLSAEGLGSISFPSTSCQLTFRGLTGQRRCSVTHSGTGERAATHAPASSPRPREQPPPPPQPLYQHMALPPGGGGRMPVSRVDHGSLFPPLKAPVVIGFTLAGCLLCTFRKKVVLAVKKQSSSSSSRLQYPLLLLLSTVIGPRPCLGAHRTAGLGLWEGLVRFCAQVLLVGARGPRLPGRALPSLGLQAPAQPGARGSVRLSLPQHLRS